MALLRNNKQKGNGDEPPKKIGRRQLISNILTVVIVFLVITSAYTALSSFGKSDPDVPISEVAKQVMAGGVKKITVEGDKLIAELENGTTIRSKKEHEASLSETFKNYGVSEQALAKTQIEIKNDTGLSFWL